MSQRVPHGKRRGDGAPPASPAATGGGIYQWVDRSRVSMPPNNTTVDVLRDRWWAVNDRGQVCLYRWGYRQHNVTPQCNADRRIVERLMPPDAVGVELLPLAFVEHRC